MVIGLENNIFEFRLFINFVFFFYGNKMLWIRWFIFRNCVCFYYEKWVVLRSGLFDFYFYEIVIGVLLIIMSFDILLKFGCV